MKISVMSFFQKQKMGKIEEKVRYLMRLPKY